MIVAGIGCRRGTGASNIEAAVRAALERAGIAASSLDAIATLRTKRDEIGIVATAAKLGIDVVFLSEAELAMATARLETRSERVLALTGVPSVAEAAALVAAGPSARLIGPRLAIGAATCALATTEPSP